MDRDKKVNDVVHKNTKEGKRKKKNQQKKENDLR
jgi:hypothetical protein